MLEEIMLIMYSDDNKGKDTIIKDKCVNLEIDREISIEEMIMATMTSSKIIVEGISMITAEGRIMDDRLVTIDIRVSLIRHRVRITHIIKGINTINSISSKVTKPNLTETSNIKGKIIKCSHTSTGREGKINNRDKINTNTKTITIKEITISNNSDTITIIKEIIIRTITIIITTDYGKRKSEFLNDKIIFNVICYFFLLILLDTYSF